MSSACDCRCLVQVEESKIDNGESAIVVKVARYNYGSWRRQKEDDFVVGCKTSRTRYTCL